MTPKNWQQVKALFHEAIELASDQRVPFLSKACANDATLRKQVGSLIRSHEEAGDFINEPAFIESGAEWLADDESGALAGQRIGHYEIMREVGRGGMGAVYLAARADELFDKQVAIKVIKRGMDTEFVLRRFTRERQMLASLDHPNIAKLLDGGVTEDGLPYFVMEYIEGTSVTEYADSHKLSINERLKLFRQICSAIQYAHQNLIVHRDIKPSNILVTKDGTPKLLDFGIAKLLNPELTETADHTATALRLMTPEYASPEQVRGEAITTASDVYSLGVLLYELLTGHRPYRLRRRVREEVVRAVCEQEPERPSAAVSRAEEFPAIAVDEAPIMLTPEHVATSRGSQPQRLRRRLAGDLDNIILKAMRKEPSRRYASAEQLSEDIRRHLEGLPVTALPDTFAYRSSKFIQRHKAGVIAAALVLLTLVAGTAATAWQAHRANVERARAERRFNDVRKLANSFLFEFHDSIKDLQGATPARHLILQRGLEYLDSLSQESRNDPALQRELATAYEKFGDLQGKALDFNIGDTAGASESYRKALKLREELVKADASSAANRRALADSYSKIGMLLWQTSERDAALENTRQALESYRQLAIESPENAALQNDLANNYLNAGMILLEQGKTAEALENEQQALLIYEKLAAHDPKDNKARRAVSRAYEKIGNVMLQNADVASALEFNRKALVIRSALSNENPANADFRRGVEISHEKIGDMLTRLGDIKGALENYRQELEICQSLADADPANAQLRQELSSPFERLGETFARLNQPIEALAYHRKALKLREELAAQDSPNVWKRWDVIESVARIARLLAVVGDNQDALEYCRKAETLAAATPDFLKDIFFS